jgi:hypothetical protein
MSSRTSTLPLLQASPIQRRLEFFACTHWRPPLGSPRDVALSSRPLRVFAARSPLSRPRSRGRRQRPDDPASAGNQGGFDRLGPRGGRGLQQDLPGSVRAIGARPKPPMRPDLPSRVTTNAYNHGHDPGQNGSASSHDCRVSCPLRSVDCRGRRPTLSGVHRLGRATDRLPLPARKLVDGHAQFAQTCRDCASGIADACGPGPPDSHRVVWGLTSRPPVSPAGFPPVSRLPAGFFPLVRRPLVSLRPAFSGSFPSAVARFRFPVGFPPGSLP